MKYLSILLIVIPHFLHGQVAKHKVAYDDPNKENLAVSFDLFTAEFYLGDEEKGIEAFGGVGYGFQASYMNLFNRMQIELNGRKNYTFDGDLPTSYFDAGFSLDLSQKSKSTKTTLQLGSAGNNKVRVLTGVGLTQMNRFRVRGGITYTNARVDVPKGLGILLGQAQVKRAGVYGGLEYSSNTNFKTNVFGYGDRRDKTMFRLYGDVIVTPIGGYGDELATGLGGRTMVPITDNLREQLDSSGMTTSFGYRVGVKYVFSFPNGININTDGFVGIKPPFVGFYTYIGTGITINIATAFQKNSEAKLEE